MKRALLFSVVSLLFVTPAFASGPSAPAPHSWTGLYAGLHLGYGQEDASFLYSSGDGSPQQSLELDGVVAGAHIGANYQFKSFVIGLEADASIASLSSSAPSGGTEIVDDVVGIDLDNLLSLRARIGFVSGNWLLYATAGIARAEWDLSFSDADSAADNGSLSISENGAVYGAGVEVALAPKLLMRVEYLHYDVGTRLNNFDFLDADGTTDFIEVDDVRVFRVGVSAKF